MATGHEDRRFQTLVDDSLYCVICTEVLRNPVQCQRNEHHFCRNCIIEHLKHSQNCPTCKDPLTVETLVKPQRFLANTLSKLKISCENYEHGCRAIVELGSLNTHVASCEFNPVPCSNDQCDEVTSRRDKEIHESKVCDFRQVKCDYCGETVVYKNLMQHTCPQRSEIQEIKRQVDKQDEMLKMVRSSQDEMLKMMRSSQDEMLKMMQTMMSKIEGITALSLCSESKNDLGSIHNIQGEIVVAGGRDDTSRHRSIEVFNMATKTWQLLSEMNECREGASSVLYQGYMIVTGGIPDFSTFDDEPLYLASDSVEELNLAQHDGHWAKSQFKLPEELEGHVCVVYKNHLLVIGGRPYSNYECNNFVSASIYEIQLASPYTSKLLTSMPRNVYYHGAEIVNNKIYIFGGCHLEYQYDFYPLNHVLMFDPATNTFTELQSLPYCVSGMATVTWKDNVVLLGGTNDEARALDTVILYNVTTGSHRMLPSMKKKRRGCTAVIIGNNIIVMGGDKDNFKLGNSVECYNFDTNTWTEFPAMIKARQFATAVVKYC